jgi:hypothetical protein
LLIQFTNIPVMPAYDLGPAAKGINKAAPIDLIGAAGSSASSGRLVLNLTTALKGRVVQPFTIK